LVTNHHCVTPFHDTQLPPNDTTGQVDILLSTPNRLAIEFEKLSQVVKHAESEWKETKRVRAEAKKNNAQLRRLEKEIVRANKHWVALRDSLNALKDRFGNEMNRVIATAWAYPPIIHNKGAADPNIITGHTQDFALLRTELDIDTENVNVLNLRGVTDKSKLDQRPELSPSFPPDFDGLRLRIRGMMSAEVFSRQSHFVVKRGASSGVLVLRSFQRVYEDDLGAKTTAWSAEQPVIAIPTGPVIDVADKFSIEGDSGSTVVDRSGRLAGILSSGGIHMVDDKDAEGDRIHRPADVTYTTAEYSLIIHVYNS